MTTLSVQVPDKYNTESVKKMLEVLFQQDPAVVEDFLLGLMMSESMSEEEELMGISELKKKHGY